MPQTWSLSTGIHYTLAAIIWLCWCCGGGNLRGLFQRVTPPTEPCSWNYITEEHRKWHFLCAKLVKSNFCWRKMHKCILVFKCLNNLVPKYLTQYFTRNADLHDHATRRNNDLHPPKPKRNMSKIIFKYAGAIYFNSLPNYVESTSSVKSFKKMLTEYWFYLIISVSYLLAHTFYIDLVRFLTVLQ